MHSLRCMNLIRVNKTPIKFEMKRASKFHCGVSIFLKKNLLLANSLTSGACMAFGDLVQQEIEFQAKLLPNRYDWGRLARMLIVGIAMGPLHHYYYVNLDKVLPKADLKTVCVKIFADQTFASPLTILGFFYGMGVLERNTLQETTSEVKDKFLFVYLGDCLYWPPVQFVNFYFLPTHYRVIYINVATMVFNVFLSYSKYYDQYQA